MAFDKDCKTYWCDKCKSAEMVLNGEACSDGMVVLVCAGCGYHREFISTAPDEFLKLYDAKMCPKCPAEMYIVQGAPDGNPDSAMWHCSKCEYIEAVE